MSLWTIGWLLWMLGFLALEGYALVSRERGATLSEHVWRWLMVGGKAPTALAWILRAGVLILLLWLIPHFLFGWFTPSDPIPW